MSKAVRERDVALPRQTFSERWRGWRWRQALRAGQLPRALATPESWVVLGPAAQRRAFVLWARQAPPAAVRSWATRALLRAAVSGPVRWVGTLLAAGAQVNVQDVRGLTPLGRALSGLGEDPAPWPQRFAIVQELLAAGADVRAMQWHGQFGVLALAPFDPECWDVLLTAGADARQIDARERSLIHRLAQAPNLTALTHALECLSRWGVDWSGPAGRDCLEAIADEGRGWVWETQVEQGLTCLAHAGVAVHAYPELLLAACFPALHRGRRWRRAWVQALLGNPQWYPVAGTWAAELRAQWERVLHQSAGCDQLQRAQEALGRQWDSRCLQHALPVVLSEARPRL